MTPSFDLSNEHRTALQTIEALAYIVRFHNLDKIDGQYKDLLTKADAIVAISDDLKIFLRSEVIKELKSQMVPFNNSNPYNPKPSNPWEISTGHYIRSTIPAIKMYRSWTGLGLKDAKAAVDRIRDAIYNWEIDVMPQGMVK